MWGQGNMVDPGRQGMEAHAEQKRLEHRKSRNPLKRRKNGGGRRSENIVARFFRALQGK